jgi:hypothetical protein
VQLTGQVVVIRPQYSNTAAGVAAGQEVFVKMYEKLANNKGIEKGVNLVV